MTENLHGLKKVVYRCHYGHRFEALVKKPEDRVQCPTCPGEWFTPTLPDVDQVSPAPGAVITEVPNPSNPNLYPPEEPK